MPPFAVEWTHGGHSTANSWGPNPIALLLSHGTSPCFNQSDGGDQCCTKGGCWPQRRWLGAISLPGTFPVCPRLCAASPASKAARGGGAQSIRASSGWVSTRWADKAARRKWCSRGLTASCTPMVTPQHYKASEPDPSQGQWCSSPSRAPPLPTCHPSPILHPASSIPGAVSQQSHGVFTLWSLQAFFPSPLSNLRKKVYLDASSRLSLIYLAINKGHIFPTVPRGGFQKGTIV